MLHLFWQINSRIDGDWRVIRQSRRELLQKETLVFWNPCKDNVPVCADAGEVHDWNP